MPLFETARAVTARLLKIVDRLAPLGPLLIRLTLGLIFIGTGWGKLHGLGDLTEFFASLHIPLPALNARVAASTEFFGGILILIGLASRLVALPLAFTMVVAIATAKWGEVEGVADFVRLDEWAYLVMFLVIALIGPGAISVDALLARRLGLRPATGAAKL